MKILLTGASGYLGQHLLSSLTDRKCEILAIYRSAENFHESLREIKASANIIPISLDISDEKAVTQWIEDHPTIDVCIHTAAVSSPKLCEEDEERAKAVNVPTKFFELLSTRGTFVIALSTDQVYCGTKAPYLEDAPTEPCNAYGRSKVEMERILMEHFRGRCALLRSSIILGPKAPIDENIAHETFLHFIESREGKETTFWVDEKRTVVAVSDVVRSIHHLVESKASGVFNMGGPDSVSRLDMAKAVFDHFGFEKKVLLPSVKAEQPSNSIPSPLDISMNSEKLHSLVGAFTSFKEIVSLTFSA